MVEYDTPMKGQRYIQETKAQIQEDMIAFVSALYGYDEDKEEAQELSDNLCQIVVDNFKKLEE